MLMELTKLVKLMELMKLVVKLRQVDKGIGVDEVDEVDGKFERSC